MSARLRSVVEGLGVHYASFLYQHPYLVLLACLVYAFVLPLGVLVVNPVRLAASAETGFDTKDTSWSGPRLAWQWLSPALRTTNRVVVQPVVPWRQWRDNDSEPRTLPSSNQSSTAVVADRARRSPSALSSPSNWGEQLIAVFQQVPCYETPIPLMSHLTQFVVELPSWDAFWSSDFLERLCEMQAALAPQLGAFDAFTPYRTVWHGANYVACLSPELLVNCSQLTVDFIDKVRSVVDACAWKRDAIVECGLRCADRTVEDCECDGVPQACRPAMLFDLFYRIFPRDLSASPVHINTFLPVFTLSGYRTQGFDVPVRLFDELESALLNYTTSAGFHVKGVLMDVKRERLVGAAIQDARLALLAALLVMICVCVHSRRPLYALAVCVQLLLAVLTALAVYSFFATEVPLLNLVIFVLLIAVGSDDAFLLFDAFPEVVSEHAFRSALKHTASTMALTSVSTAVPFFVNVASAVLVFRCFGLFAGVTMLVNYSLVVSWLPAVLLILRTRNPFAKMPSLPRIGGWLGYSVRHHLPAVLLQGRFLWLLGLSLVLAAGAATAALQLHLPDANPLQLFVSANPHEWYDNNAQATFEFVAAKVAIPLFVRLVWGILPAQSDARFRASTDVTLSADTSFSLKTVADVKRLATTLAELRSQPFSSHPHAYWPERFLDWSSSQPCPLPASVAACCNIDHSSWHPSFLDHCLRNSTQFLYTQYNDTPIFDNSSLALIGYTALLPTRLTYAHRFANLSANFDTFERAFDHLAEQGGWYTTEWYLMSTWFDLQRSIVSDCRWSVIVSFAVVSAFAIIQLGRLAPPAILCIAAIICTSVGCVVALGWVIGVLEAVILVLVVGLSFDYTLHLGAAVPRHGCSVHRVREAAQRAAVPVSLAAVTSVVAGMAMLPADTHAFFQVGVFLVVSTAVSWLYALFFFLPLLSFCLPRTDFVADLSIAHERGEGGAGGERISTSGCEHCAREERALQLTQQHVRKQQQQRRIMAAATAVHQQQRRVYPSTSSAGSSTNSNSRQPSIDHEMVAKESSSSSTIPVSHY